LDCAYVFKDRLDSHQLPSLKSHANTDKNTNDLPRREDLNYIPSRMMEQDQLEQKLKAEAFDRLMEKYRTLEDGDGFYSRHWLEFSVFLEQEAQKVQLTLGNQPAISDS